MCILCNCINNNINFDIDNYYLKQKENDDNRQVFIRNRFNKYSIKIKCNKLQELPKFKSNKEIFDITLDGLNMNNIDGSQILDENNKLLKYNTITICNSFKLKEIVNFKDLNGIIIEYCNKIELLSNITNITQLVINETDILNIVNLSNIESIIIENSNIEYFDKIKKIDDLQLKYDMFLLNIEFINRDIAKILNNILTIINKNDIKNKDKKIYLDGSNLIDNKKSIIELIS